MKILFLYFGMVLSGFCLGQLALESTPMPHVAFHSVPIDSLDFLWLECTEYMDQEWEDEETEVEVNYALAYHRDFGQTLLAYSDSGYMAYSFGEENYLRLYGWHLQVEQLNDGQAEVIVSLASSYGRGYCHSSWGSDLVEVFVLDLDRKQILAQLASSETNEEWIYPTGCDEAEEETGENTTEESDEDEYEILSVYNNVERLVEVAQGKILIETIAYEVEGVNNPIADGYYAWDGKVLAWKDRISGE